MGSFRPMMPDKAANSKQCSRDTTRSPRRLTLPARPKPETENRVYTRPSADSMIIVTPPKPKEGGADTRESAEQIEYDFSRNSFVHNVTMVKLKRRSTEIQKLLAKLNESKDDNETS